MAKRPATGLDSNFHTTRTPSRLACRPIERRSRPALKNNGLQNLYRIVRRTFFVLTVIVRTNLLMTPIGSFGSCGA